MFFEKPSYYTTLRTLSWKGKSWLPLFFGLLLLLMLSFKHLFAFSYCLSAFLNSCLYMDVADRRTEKKTRVEQPTTKKKMCPGQSKHTCASGAFYIFLLQALLESPLSNPRPPLSIYTPQTEHVFLSMLHYTDDQCYFLKERGKTKTKKKGIHVCVDRKW